MSPFLLAALMMSSHSTVVRKSSTRKMSGDELMRRIPGMSSLILMWASSGSVRT
jgi:hypothetical protein